MREVVGVIRGGPSSEYEVSLRSGAHILEHLNKEKYEPRDLFIDRAGQWHLHGAPVTPERALRGVDVALNVIHGQYGEDGTLQEILQTFAVPYAGPDAKGASLAFNKHLSREAAKALGVRVPHGALVDSSKITSLHQTALNIFRSMPHPMMVKPVIGGSSVGMSKVEGFHALEDALERAFKIAPQALIEEYIKGREAAVGVIDDFRGQSTYALMPVEIIPPKRRPFFDYEAKYSGESLERVPGHFTQEQKHELARLASLVHEGLGQQHYSRSDFIVAPRGIYFLEINSAPGIGMTSESLMPKALKAVGASVGNFLDHVVELARRRQLK